jgi:hypothetical protein
MVLLAVALLIVVIGPGEAAQMGGDCELVGQRSNGESVWICPPEPTPAETPTATATATASPTATLTPTATTPPMPGHNTLEWHAPAEGHHHGHDPLDTIFGGYIAANWPHTLAHSWPTSDAENGWPVGKHTGYQFLYEEATGCADRTNSGANCPVSYLLEVHSIGTGHAFRTRVHSFRLLATICGPGGRPPCGLVEMGGHFDFGQLHSQYKQTLCPLPGSAVYEGDANGFAPPYTSINGSARDAAYWNAVITPGTERAFDPAPQRHVSAAWFELDPWSVPGPGAACVDPANDVLTGGRQTRFQLFILSVKLDSLPTARPFSGFTDVYGDLAPDCQAEGPNCVPLYIGEGVPAGDALLFRAVDHGNPDAAPIQVYGADADLIMNPYEHGH